MILEFPKNSSLRHGDYSKKHSALALIFKFYAHRFSSHKKIKFSFFSQQQNLTLTKTYLLQNTENKFKKKKMIHNQIY